MKFTDKKYSHLECVDGIKSYYTTFYPYQIGFDDSYDDIVVELQINPDNTMDLNFDADTIIMFNNPVQKLVVCQTKQDSMLKMFKKQLLKHPFPNDELELKFNK